MGAQESGVTMRQWQKVYMTHGVRQVGPLADYCSGLQGGQDQRCPEVMSKDTTVSIFITLESVSWLLCLYGVSIHYLSEPYSLKGDAIVDLSSRDSFCTNHNGSSIQ